MPDYIVPGIIVLVVALLAVYIISTYNKLVKERNRVVTQWAQIDVHLTRRADLIPNLVEMVKSYVSHEKDVFEKVVSARNAFEGAVSPGQAITANDQLSRQLLPLLAVAEAYPDLKADRNFAELQSALKEAEEKIAYARQFYNDSVLIYRDRLQQFPSNIIAGMFRFKDASYFMPAEEKKNDLKIDL
jgi:LemA protein